MEREDNDLYFKIAESVLDLEKCYRLRYQVYCEEKRWLSPNDFPDGMETDEFDNKAVHVMALDADFNCVGIMRIIKDCDHDRLPFLDHPGMKGKSYKTNNLAELSRFVITAKTNRHLVLKGLLRLVYLTSRRIGVDNWVYVSEPSLIRFIDRYKYYFNPICAPAKYYGGFTLIAACDISETEARWKTNDMETWNFHWKEEPMMI
jgi:N-acyl-L-homoserine lactone synthetase